MAEPVLLTCSDVPCTMMGKGTPSPIPMIQDVWQIFSKKGIRTVFMSIGQSVSSSADLELAESIGCPLHAITFSDEEGAAWTEVSDILKSRKRDPAQHVRTFSDGAEKRWMLAKNLRVSRVLPWWSAGTVEGEIPTQGWLEVVQRICKEMKLPDDQLRLDILKVDMTQKYAGLERPVLISLLDAGFCPSVLVVRWADAPTTNLATTHTAGFLQMAGYALLGRVGDAFLYFYTDRDLFQVCSWEEPMLENPLAKDILAAAAGGAAAPAPAPESSQPTVEGAATI